MSLTPGAQIPAGTPVNIDELIQLMIEAGIDPQQLGVTTSALQAEPTELAAPVSDVPDPSQAPATEPSLEAILAEMLGETLGAPLEGPLLGQPPPPTGPAPLLDESQMTGSGAIDRFPTLPPPTVSGQVPIEDAIRQREMEEAGLRVADPGDLPGFLGLLQNAQAAEERIAESGLTELPSLQPSAPETPAEEIVPEFFQGIEDMIFGQAGAEIGQKTPEELTPDEVEFMGPILAESGMEQEAVDALTGQGEAGAAAQETGMSIGELLLLFGAIGVGGALLGAIAPVDEPGGETRGSKILQGLSLALAGGGQTFLALSQQEGKQINAEALQNAKVVEALRKEELDKDRQAYEDFLDGKLDMQDPANSALLARAERHAGGEFVPSKDPIEKDPTREMRDALRAARDATDNGLPDVAAKFNARALELSRDFAINYDDMPIQEALDTFLALRPSIPERVRSFTVLAPRLVRELGLTKKALKEIAKQRGIEKQDAVKTAIESALGEVPGPVRGQ